MKILILTSQTRDSGSWIRAQGLASGLASAGHDVSCPPPSLASPLFGHLLWPGFQYLWLVLRQRPAVVLVLKPYPHTMLAGLAAKIFWRAKLICDVDDLDWAYRKGMGKGLLKIVQRPWPKLSDLVTYHHPLLREEILKHFQVESGKLEMLPQGTYLEFPTKTSEGMDQIRKSLGFTDCKVVGYMAHFNLASEEGAVLRIFSQLRSSYQNVRLLLIGGGPAWPALKHRLEKNSLENDVVLTGHLAQKDVQPHLQICDALLFWTPDRSANRFRCSLKLRDYMASGRPIVANLLFEAEEYADVLYTSARDGEKELAELLGQVLAGQGDGREIRGPLRIRGQSWARIGGQFAESLNRISN